MKNQANVNGKKQIVCTKEKMIRRIAKEFNGDIDTVKAVYNLLERNIAEVLSSADKKTDVSIRLFEGISIDSTFIPEKEKINNLTGELLVTKKKIKPKANITRYYCDKITNYNK